jgi:hypothetical protein
MTMCRATHPAFSYTRCTLPGEHEGAHQVADITWQNHEPYADAMKPQNLLARLDSIEIRIEGLDDIEKRIEELEWKTRS